LLRTDTPGRKARAPQKPQAAATASMTAKIVKTLEASPRQAFSAAQLAERLAVKNINSLNSTLFRLAQKRRIRKLPSGAYGARQQATAKA
jgi:hypothetical protein